VQQHILYLDLQADGIQGHWMSPQAQLLLGRQNPSPENLHTEDGQGKSNKTKG